MFNIVSFSGGRTSAYMVYLIEEMRKRGDIDNVHYVFMDTGAEHPKTYEFVKNVVNHFDIDLKCIMAKINPEHGIGTTYERVALSDVGYSLDVWKSFVDKYGTPYAHLAHCTKMMKTEPYNKFCNEMFGKGNYISWLGIRIDEPKRLRPRDDAKYLADISDYEKLDILDFWRNQPFDLGIEEWLGNCVFCVKKGTNKIALAAIDEPAMAREFSDILASDSVKTLPSKTSPNECCYRGQTSIPQIIESFSGHSRSDIIAGLRPSSGACSESCEAFEFQIDMSK